MSFAPAGLITLTTDFGVDDPFVGIVKARILSGLPEARLVDLTHGIAPGRADLAGFWLGLAWREFPAGTVHLAVVDPGVGTDRGVLLAEAGGHLLLGPDNGLLPEALRGCDGVLWRAMEPGLPDQLGLLPLSRTFHGRDLFAPLAALLAAGRLGPAEFGAETAPTDPRPLPRPQEGVNLVTGRVILADRFGNLITNIGDQSLGACRQPVLEIGDRRLPLVGTYGEAPHDALLALVNAFGLVEIARNGGSAASTLGCGEGSPVRLRDGFET